MRSTVDVYLYPGGDENFHMFTTRHGTTLVFGDEVRLNWYGPDGTQRAAATLRRWLTELEQELGIKP